MVERIAGMIHEIKSCELVGTIIQKRNNGSRQLQERVINGMSKTAFLFQDKAYKKPGWGKIFMNTAPLREIFDMASKVLQMDMKKAVFYGK